MYLTEISIRQHLKIEITCDLSNNGLRDPPVIQEGLDLLLHQVAISPATTNTHVLTLESESEGRLMI